jgi:hypothetical protein
MLDRLDISGDDAPRQRNSYLELRAMVLLRLGRGTDAQKAYEESISIVEDLRSDLKSYSDKMSWQAKNEDRYELGALIALDNSDLCASLDLVEKSKSRAFMDQLKTGHIPLPEADQALEDIHENLSRKRNLLLRLSDSIKIAGPTIMDYDALGELGTLTETIDLLEQQPDGTRRLSISKIDQELADVEDTLVRVRHQIEDARLTSIQETSVPVLTLRELRAIMKV